MRKTNTKLEKQIREKTLELLLEKEPSEIGMRDIAEKCGVTATTIYHYYKDKDDVFKKVSLDCLNEVKTAMEERILLAKDSKKMFMGAITAFRDWCFENPRRALLVMGKIKVDSDADEADLQSYYACNRLGEMLLTQCIKEKLAATKTPKLDINVIIFGLWGCIESVLLKRADTDFWEQEKMYTDRFIEIALDTIFTSKGKKL